MRYSQTGPELMLLEGPHAEFRLMGQGLTALRIETESGLDDGPAGENPLWGLDEIDNTLSRLPKVEADAEEAAGYMPERGMNVRLYELEMTCSGLRIAHRAARLQRVVLGVPDTNEVAILAGHLHTQAESYGALHSRLNEAKSNWGKRPTASQG